MKALVVFPPGWSQNVGNPHIALPLLKSTLETSEVEVTVRDLNWEVAEYHCVHINQREALEAVQNGTMETMNEPYFRAEDRLMSVAKKYSGEWNLQLGFKFDKFSSSSSNDIRDALPVNSPFTEFFKCVVLPSVTKGSPELIGFSIASVYQLIPSLHLTWLLRKAGYEGLIVFGGNTVSRLRKEIAATPWLFDLVDGFIVFQGEIPLVNLSSRFLRRDCFPSVPNLIWRDGNEVKVNAARQYQNPNFVPTPDFGDLPVGQYWGVNYLPLVAARGCYYGQCIFCAIPYGFGERGFSGIRSTGMVFDDIRTLLDKHDISRFKFMDEALPPRILRDLPEWILEARLNIEWEAYLRLERQWLDRNFVGRVAMSGFRKGYFGLEIFPEETRRQLGKSDGAKNILRVLENCYETGIKVHLFCMFGFPGTGRKEAERTIDFILEHKDWIDSVDLNAYTYAKHTSVPGIEKIVKPDEDWALEYEYRGLSKEIMNSREVEELATEMEEIVWTDCPRLLHPTYRLISPWTCMTEAAKDQDVRSIAI